MYVLLFVFLDSLAYPAGAVDGPAVAQRLVPWRVGTLLHRLPAMRNQRVSVRQSLEPFALERRQAADDVVDRDSGEVVAHVRAERRGHLVRESMRRSLALGNPRLERDRARSLRYDRGRTFLFNREAELGVPALVEGRAVEADCDAALVAHGKRLPEVVLRRMVVRPGLAVKADAHRVGIGAVQGEDRRRDAGRVRPTARLSCLHVEHADALRRDRDLVARFALRPHERRRHFLVGGDNRFSCHNFDLLRFTKGVLNDSILERMKADDRNSPARIKKIKAFL